MSHLEPSVGWFAAFGESWKREDEPPRDIQDGLLALVGGLQGGFASGKPRSVTHAVSVGLRPGSPDLPLGWANGPATS